MQYYKPHTSRTRFITAEVICCLRLRYIFFNKGKTENEIYRMARIVIRSPIYRNKTATGEEYGKSFYYSFILIYLGQKNSKRNNTTIPL